MVDCSKNSKLNTVPDKIPCEVVELDLSEHFIILHADDFENCSNIRQLNLHLINSNSLPKDIFKSLLNIRSIWLHDNHLQYNKDCFPTNLFKNLSSLRAISLQMQSIRTPSMEAFDGMLQMLPLTLEELSINIPNEIGVEMLNNFKRLRKLGLYGRGMNLKIQNDTFKPLRYLPIEELRIKVNNLDYVQPLGFRHFPNLKKLDMSETTGMTIADFYPAMLGLENTKLEILKLSYFTKNISKPELVILNGTHQQNFDLRNLVILEMDNAEIFLIGDAGIHLSKLLNLKTLNMSFNFLNLKHINAILWDWLLKLRELDLSYQTYTMRGRTGGVSLVLPPNLTTLCLSNRLMDTDFPSAIIIKTRTNITNFQLKGTSMEYLITFNVNYPNPAILFEADLSSNNMVSFGHSFDNSILSGLRVNSLLLHRNKLGRRLDEQGERIFRYFTNLTKLDLTLNEIKNLPHSIFINQRELKYLNLSKNALVFVRFQISHMRNILILDLSDNLISQLDQQLRDDIDLLKFHSPNFTINMLGNPIQCSCETRTFLWWMYHKRSMFTQFEEYTCIYNNEAMYFGNMSLLLETMDFHCSQNLIMKLAAGLLAFVIFVVALSVFVYRHKWDVKFFCLRFITDRKAYQELQEMETEYEYDAFVSYHKDDRGWVRNELYENIDMRDGEVDTIDQPRFRLCIHDRDFIPGEAIEENILKAIESSRKTIVVLSREFLEKRMV